MNGKDDLAKNMGERIMIQRKKAEYGVRAFARAIGVSPSSISEYESGKRSPNAYTLNRISETLNINVSYFLGQISRPAQMRKRSELAEPVGLPVYNSASCGNGTMPLETPIDYQTKPNDVEGDYWVIAHGDSMTPLIQDGDKLLVKTSKEIHDNDIVVALIDLEIYCKMIILSGETVILNSLNREHDNIVLSRRDANNKILGKVTFRGSKI